MVDQKREQEVWQRVMELSAQAPARCKMARPETVTAPEIMEKLVGELEDSKVYEALACRVRGDTRRYFLMLAAQERRHYDRLETVYYLMTGKKPCPDRPKRPCIACTNEALRERYIHENEGAAGYSALAKKGGSFAKVFLELAHDEEAHAQKVLDILQACL